MRAGPNPPFSFSEDESPLCQKADCVTTLSRIELIQLRWGDVPAEWGEDLEGPRPCRSWAGRRLGGCRLWRWAGVKWVDIRERDLPCLFLPGCKGSS